MKSSGGDSNWTLLVSNLGMNGPEGGPHPDHTIGNVPNRYFKLRKRWKMESIFILTTIFAKQVKIIHPRPADQTRRPSLLTVVDWYAPVDASLTKTEIRFGVKTEKMVRQLLVLRGLGIKLLQETQSSYHRSLCQL